MPHNNKLGQQGDGHPRDARSRTRGRVARGAIILTGTAALALAAAAPAYASGGEHAVNRYQRPAITLVAVTPSPHDVSGAGGVFNVDLVALARNAAGKTGLGESDCKQSDGDKLGRFHPKG